MIIPRRMSSQYIKATGALCKVSELVLLFSIIITIIIIIIIIFIILIIIIIIISSLFDVDVS